MRSENRGRGGSARVDVDVNGRLANVRHLPPLHHEGRTMWNVPLHRSRVGTLHGKHYTKKFVFLFLLVHSLLADSRSPFNAGLPQHSFLDHRHPPHLSLTPGPFLKVPFRLQKWSSQKQDYNL